MIFINANVSGWASPAAVPVLQHDSGLRYDLRLDPDNSRGHFELPNGSPAGGWTLIWADQSLRVWLSLDESHQPLPPGSYEMALLHGDAAQPMPAVLAYQPASLPLVAVAGLDLIAGGQRWTYDGATHFLALERFILGGPSAVVDYPNANIYRVFGTCVNISTQAGLPALDPDGFGDYFGALGDFAGELNRRGKYLDFCALADIQLLKKSPAWCQEFVRRCGETLAGHPNVLFDLGNEPWNNGFDPAAFARPPVPFPCSRGSIEDAAGSSGFDGPGITWDVIRVHTRRDFPKMLTHCALPDPLFTYGKPIIIDEPFKVCDPTHGGYFDPRLARIAGALGRAINGICFHCPSGCFSLPLTPAEEACRAAFFAG